MELVIRPSAEAASRLVARLVAVDLKIRPSLVLGLATGRTMDAVYRMLVTMHHTDALDFSRCRTFNLDEYVGLGSDHPQSFRRYMDEHFFSRVNIDSRKTFLPDGTAPNLDAECRRYEQQIEACGGIDLQLLGIGKSGHIGFNEPLSALRSRTRVKALSPATVEQNAPQFGSPSRVPARAITMGVGTILDARRVLVLATGHDKADIVAKAVEGPITSMISATALQWHPRATFIVDEAAAAKLTQTDYYRRIFATEPEWEPFREIT